MQVHKAVFITQITNLELPAHSTYFSLKYIETSVFLFSLLDTYEAIGLPWAGAFHITGTQAGGHITYS